MIEPMIRWKTVWSNGVPTYFVAFSHMSTVKIAEVEKFAAHGGYLVNKSRWKPTEVASLHRLIASLNSTGVQAEFENDDENGVFDMCKRDTNWGSADSVITIVAPCPIHERL